MTRVSSRFQSLCKDMLDEYMGLANNVGTALSAETALPEWRNVGIQAMCFERAA